MKFAIIIPVYNEEAFLKQMLQSIVNQTKIPDLVVLVNDNSTDGTQKIIDLYTSKYPFIKGIMNTSEAKHLPGSKVVNAFYKGFKTLKENFDLIGKFDADIILPNNYFEKIIQLFSEDNKVGLAGGNLYIEEKEKWVFETISEKTKVRGPIKLYRKECFQSIGGLKKSIGWDTVDGLLAVYHGWKIKADTSLHVKHLKPTGASYTKEASQKQGEAFYRMRYGKALTRIASLKLALNKNQFNFYFECMQGYKNAKKQQTPFIVNQEEGNFIRELRWKGIKAKIL
ncbi:glycosyl transferase family 2 [Patiriisocius marinistellae]|uniref:Glycosyl transferase family 2 n=1 Tax=Patiriisocius marinistellae TaxID=2494560 RepID=A0A5J4FUM5_9FLAO|nr:glycosyltransferase family A protein [Patiriisocius marinistellae]GEQ85590.1 glycosyl transferase family 2 [Patiriisocius marinistellae]